MQLKLKPLMAIVSLLILFMGISVHADTTVKKYDCDLTAVEQNQLVETHAPLGIPNYSKLLVRRAFVMDYSEKHRIPLWAYWRATQENSDTPTRKGKWKAFRTDPTVKNPVNDDDYKYLTIRNPLGIDDLYARGHLVPYFISGGDRNDDGKDAEIEEDTKLPIEDIYDACTVFEVNNMTNITPQYQKAFNGSGGNWYRLETKIRKAVKAGAEYFIVAGVILGDNPKMTGNPKDEKPDDIVVPDMFYKVIYNTGRKDAEAYLFAHEKNIESKGCSLNDSLEDCRKELEVIEDLLGFKLLP
jgi:DNA/RNA endonuclease G (NUC1)